MGVYLRSLPLHHRCRRSRHQQDTRTADWGTFPAGCWRRWNVHHVSHRHCGHHVASTEGGMVSGLSGLRSIGKHLRAVVCGSVVQALFLGESKTPRQSPLQAKRYFLRAYWSILAGLPRLMLTHYQALTLCDGDRIRRQPFARTSLPSPESAKPNKTYPRRTQTL